MLMNNGRNTTMKTISRRAFLKGVASDAASGEIHLFGHVTLLKTLLA